jgi:hypothetical protein
MTSYILFRTHCSILFLKSLSKNTNKLIISPSPLFHFIRINSFIANSNFQYHYNTKISNNNNDNIHGHILYYLKEEEMSLKDFDLDNITKIKKNNLKKKIYQTNKKRLFIKQNIIQVNFDALEGKSIYIYIYIIYICVLY